MSLSKALSIMNSFKRGAFSEVRISDVADACHHVGIAVVTSNSIPSCLKYDGLSVSVSEDTNGRVITRDPATLKLIAEIAVPNGHS
jgi:hypothetical protein